MKQLINYKPTNEKMDEFPYVKLLLDREVFVDLPICVVDFGRHYNKPVLYGNYQGIPTVYEEKEVIQLLGRLKTFHLKNENGKLTEVEEAEADVHIKLPKDTNVDQLVFDNGQVFWAKPIKKETEVKEDGSN